MRGACGATGYPSDLFKGQSAPQVGDDDLALIDRQCLELAGSLLRIDGSRTLVRIGLEPGRSPERRGGLVSLAPPGGLPCNDGPVADDPEKPGSRVVRQRALSRQLQKRILDHVLRYVTPLPREQFERGGVLVQEVAEQVRIHAISASPIVD